METTERIIPRSDLKLRKIGSKYMIVEASEGCERLTNVYSLNETAALLWKELCDRAGSETSEAGDIANGKEGNEEAMAQQEGAPQGRERQEAGSCGYRTPGELAERLCTKYNVDYDRAIRDVLDQLEEWEKMGLVSRQRC